LVPFYLLKIEVNISISSFTFKSVRRELYPVPGDISTRAGIIKREASSIDEKYGKRPKTEKIMV
jgi:hypothetical protein